MKANIRPPTRTAMQGGLAFGITELLDSFAIVPMDERQYGAVLLMLTIALSFSQKVVEDRLGKSFPRLDP